MDAVVAICSVAPGMCRRDPLAWRKVVTETMTAEPHGPMAVAPFLATPDKTPRAIRAALLPEEVGDFDREFRAVMPSLVDLLEIHPWSGDSYNRKRPDVEHARSCLRGSPRRPGHLPHSRRPTARGRAAGPLARLTVEKTGLRSSFAALLGHYRFGGTGVNAGDPFGLVPDGADDLFGGVTGCTETSGWRLRLLGDLVQPSAADAAGSASAPSSPPFPKATTQTDGWLAHKRW
jgi:hypothetical protein